MDSSLIEPGRHIGELRIERELGRGAFGTVFLARDSLLHRLVALKVVRTPGGELGGEQREQALKEARLIAGLHSPHIVTLYRVHSLPEGTGWMFEMEYVEGGSLHALFKEKRTVPLERTLPIVCAMVRGLKVAHDRDIVHGDIKPANVLLGKDGEVKLADFGLARFIGDHSLSVSDAGQPVGTPSYMAPEVIMGEAPRVASDLWSVGVLLYRILGGKLPFHEDHLLSLFLSIQNAAPALLDPATPPELADLAFRCLTKEPELRPTSCEEILATLERPQTTAVARVPGKRPKPVRPPAPELFGRETEEERLGSLLLERSEGSAKTVLLSGEAGIGKTSLVRRVMADDAFAEWLWIEASLTAAQGLLRAVAQGAGDVLDSDFTRFGAAAPVLRQLTSVGGPDALVDRQQGVWAVEELLAGLTAERPVAVFVEDAQIADDEDIEVLKGLSRRLPLLGVPLVINYRTHDPSSSDTSGTLQVRELAVIEGVQCVDLVPLPNEALYRVVESFVGGLTIGAEILERVVRLAAGNPFFAKELMRHLEDSRAIVRQPPDLVPGPGWADAKLPSSLTGLVERRLGDLDEEDRTLLDVAAVDGMEFDGEALASALDRPLLTVLRSLQRLYRDAGLLVAKDRGFRFSNAILQETIYEGLAPELRRALHQRLAAHLEKRSEMAPVDPARLGTHWERADEHERAAPHLRHAAWAASQRQEYMRAIRLARRAGLGVETLDSETAQEHADLLLSLAGNYADVGRHDDAERIFDRLLVAADELGDKVLRLRTVVWRDDIRYFQKGADAIDEAALETAVQELPDSPDLGRARYLLGIIAKYRGQLDEAARWFEEADELFTRLEMHALHSSALDELGSVALRRGRFVEAEALYSDAARISAAGGRRSNAAISEVNRTLASFARGELTGLDTSLERSIQTLQLEGAQKKAAIATAHLAAIRYAQGDLEGAERALRLAMHTLEQSRVVMGLAFACVEKAHYALARGQLGDARDALERSCELAGRYGDRRLLVRAAALKAHIRCVLGDPEGAVAAVQDGFERVQEAPHRTRIEFALRVAEAAPFRLPAVAVEQVMDLVPPADPGVGALHELARATIAGAHAAGRSRGAEGLRSAAAALAEPGVGQHRAESVVLSGWFRARMLTIEGDRAGAAEAARTGWESATRLGHVWLQAAFLQLLAGLEPDGDHARRLRVLVEGIEKDLPSAEDRSRLAATWAP